MEGPASPAGAGGTRGRAGTGRYLLRSFDPAPLYEPSALFLDRYGQVNSKFYQRNGVQCINVFSLYFSLVAVIVVVYNVTIVGIGHGLVLPIRLERGLFSADEVEDRLDTEGEERGTALRSLDST